MTPKSYSHGIPCTRIGSSATVYHHHGCTSTSTCGWLTKQSCCSCQLRTASSVSAGPRRRLPAPHTPSSQCTPPIT